MKRITPALIVAFLWLSGCTPLERTAYNTVVAAKAFLDKEKMQHPECKFGEATVDVHTTVCDDIRKAVGSKDALIDAITVYCSGPEFNTGGACNAPDVHSAAGVQAEAKLRAAITQYNQTAADLKQATGGK
jgi:hypothetical protein